MKLYLAGPMTGIPQLNYPLFQAEAARLRQLGYEVVSPAEINANAEDGWVPCMRRDIAELVKCDGIALLPGWQKSRGAQLAYHIALQLGLWRLMAHEMVTAIQPNASLQYLGLLVEVTW